MEWLVRLSDGSTLHADTRQHARERARQFGGYVCRIRYAVRFTADIYTPESLDAGIPDRSGWVEPAWSVWAPDSEQTAASTFDTWQAALRYIEQTIGAVEPSGTEDYGTRGTYYAVDDWTDSHSIETGEHARLAGHIERVEVRD